MNKVKPVCMLLVSFVVGACFVGCAGVSKSEVTEQEEQVNVLANQFAELKNVLNVEIVEQANSENVSLPDEWEAVKFAPVNQTSIVLTVTADFNDEETVDELKCEASKHLLDSEPVNIELFVVNPSIYRGLGLTYGVGDASGVFDGGKISGLTTECDSVLKPGAVEHVWKYYSAPSTGYYHVVVYNFAGEEYVYATCSDKTVPSASNIAKLLNNYPKNINVRVLFNCGKLRFNVVSGQVETFPEMVKFFETVYSDGYELTNVDVEGSLVSVEYLKPLPLVNCLKHAEVAPSYVVHSSSCVG